MPKYMSVYIRVWCMSFCVHVCRCMCIVFMHMCVCVPEYVHACMSLCMCVCMSGYACACMSLWGHAWVWCLCMSVIHKWVCACMFAYLSIFVYPQKYVCVHPSNTVHAWCMWMNCSYVCMCEYVCAYMCTCVPMPLGLIYYVRCCLQVQEYLWLKNSIHLIEDFLTPRLGTVWISCFYRWWYIPGLSGFWMKVLPC